MHTRMLLAQVTPCLREPFYWIMAKIQHSVFFCLPDLVLGSDDEIKLTEIAAKFNSIDGVCAQFTRHGSKIMQKEEFLAAAEWPDRSVGFTHCLLAIMDDLGCLKAYLHSDLHKKEWVAVVGPYVKGIVVFDSDLAVPLVAKEETIIHTGLFKMPELEDGGESHKAMLQVIDQFNEIAGIEASFKRCGTAALCKDEMLAEVSWPDKTGGFTHLLCVIADDLPALKRYLHGDAHKEWVQVARPNMKGDPPSMIFDTPLP